MKKSEMRAKAHTLKPVVLLGQHGYTPAVSAEIDHALNDHELIKVKLGGEDRSERNAIIATICQELDAELIQTIGKIVVLYRKNPEKTN